MSSQEWMDIITYTKKQDFFTLNTDLVTRLSVFVRICPEKPKSTEIVIERPVIKNGNGAFKPARQQTNGNMMTREQESRVYIRAVVARNKYNLAHIAFKKGRQVSVLSVSDWCKTSF